MSMCTHAENTHRHTNTLPPVLHCTSTCFFTFCFFALCRCHFFLFPPPLVWEKVIAKAKKDVTGRITLSPFFRELLEGIKNTQTEPPSLHSSIVYSSNSWCCASSAGWTNWGKIARSRSRVRFHSSQHKCKQMYQRVKRTPLISHQSLGVAGTELAVVKGITLKLNTVTFPS